MATTAPIVVRVEGIPEVAALLEAALGTRTHQCPPEGSGIMPCCGRTPFEVPRTDRMTLDSDSVTCGAQ